MVSKYSSESLKNLCECPVCFEPFKSPRLLKCGHQFCENCLKDVADHTPQGHIPCPVCRDVTKPQHGDVTTLPRSTLHQYMQELIFGQPTEEALGQKCTKCKVNKPTRHCLECKPELSHLCDNCYTTHQKLPRFASHKTVVFDPLLVCTVHPHKMVECFCYHCSNVACEECLFETHPHHNIEGLKEAAEKSRAILDQYRLKQQEKVIRPVIMTHFEHASKKLQNIKKDNKMKVDKIKAVCKAFEHQLDQSTADLDKVIDKELNNINSIQAKITEFTSANDKMLKLAESLLGDVSDPQAIMGSRDLPEPDIDITEIEVNVPVIGEQFDKMADDLETMTKSVNISYKKEVYNVERESNQLWNLQKQDTVAINTNASGLILSVNGTKVTVRTGDTSGPIKVYKHTTDWTLEKTLGSNMTNVTETEGLFRSISLDTTRDLYLLPCADGSLVRMEMDGRIRDTSKLGSSLCGVAYLQDQDMYVLSDIGNPAKVFMVSPDKESQVVRTCQDNNTFDKPQYREIRRVV